LKGQGMGNRAIPTYGVLPYSMIGLLHKLVGFNEGGIV
jgi:hypothetical protein